MPEFPNFASPHVHPSSLDSASTPEAFADREIELGTGALTSTDHGTLGGCWKIYELARNKGLTPILGLEGYFRDDNCPILKQAGIPKDKDGTYRNYWKYAHVTLHFLDQKAYETGVKLLSKADTRAEYHGSERKPLFGWNEIEELASQNITMFSGCLIGIIQRHLIAQDNWQIAIKYYEKFRSLYKNLWHIEIFPHVCDKYWESGVFITFKNGVKQKFNKKKKLRTNVGEIEAGELVKLWGKSDHNTLLAIKNYHTWAEQEPSEIQHVEWIEDALQNECKVWSPTPDYQLWCNKFMLRLAEKYGDPVLISDDSHFAYPSQKILQDVKLGSSGGQWRMTNSYHRQSSEESWQYFSTQMGVSEAQFRSWLQNNQEWASRFKDFKLEYSPSLPTKFYPQDTLGHTMELIKKHGRMDWSDQAYVERLGTEIKMLHQNGKIDLLPYFFLCEEATSLYKDANILTGPGRGSAAGLLLTYLLGITHVDPLRYDLSMERFITLDRIKSNKLPDIDLDFPHRDLLLDPKSLDFLELEDELGNRYNIQADIQVSTPEGKMPVKQAVEKGLDILDNLNEIQTNS